MAFIRFAKIDKSLTVIIMGCIFCFLNRLINQVKSELNENPIINDIVISPSRFLI